ncbi:MAG: hypothetical protein K2Y35_15065 [Burkholderiales bacterium]|nr:hypothetical protein [Burkholderiales bacterium]
MSKWILMALAAGAIATVPAFAEEMAEHRKDSSQEAAPEVVRPEQLDLIKKHNDEMESHLKDMQMLMDKMQGAKDTKERRKLMDEHARSMREMMKNMRSSSGDMKMGMMGGGARRGGPLPEGEKMRQHLLEKRIDMMDMMMDQMMKAQDMTKSTP